MRPATISIGMALIALSPTSALATEGFHLADGDRVVLLGNALIEREQRYGYWETLLTLRYPDKSIAFRNLGWSGDTVFGDARASFGTAADGFRHLEEHVASLKPTVILVGYGSNESFEGEAGLPRFLKGLEVLLDTLAQTKARIVLLSPLRQEDLGCPLPDPARQNHNLRLYSDALARVAAQRGYSFVDLYQLLGDGTKVTPPVPLTDNGIHLTAYGYWKSASVLMEGLGQAAPPWQLAIDAGGKNSVARGARVDQIGISQSGDIHFRVLDAILPAPLPPNEGAPRNAPKQNARVLRITNVAPGSWTLAVDGKVVATASADEWAAGVKLTRGSEFDQVERLRQAIVAKNRLYFYRWRPQNETYLFGFRKHEQGQNAREIPQFDPLVAQLEAEIAKLRIPVSHQYQLVKQPEKGK